MGKKTVISIVLTFVLLFGGVMQCMGITTQEQISDVKAEQQETESRLAETKSLISQLESKKQETEVYLEQLNGQLEELKIELQNLQDEYDKKQGELNVVQADLAVARQEEKEQYEAMKLRIQYMYENSITNGINMIFQADSITDLLNQAENFSRMTEYDREALKEYSATKELIEAKEKEVIAEQEAIAAVQQECTDNQAAMELLVEATYNQVREYQAELNDQESKQSRLLEQISQQEEEINGLLRKAKEEEAAKKAQEEAERKAVEAAKRAEEEAKKQQTSNQKPSASKPAVSVQDSKPSSESTSEGRYLGRFKLTAYCNCTKCCGKWAGGSTASGTTPTAGRTIAMSGVPFGTQFKINGHVYTVEDRGTAYGHIDVFVASHAEALSFGVRYADVYQVE